MDMTELPVSPRMAFPIALSLPAAIQEGILPFAIGMPRHDGMAMAAYIRVLDGSAASAFANYSSFIQNASLIFEDVHLPLDLLAGIRARDARRKAPVQVPQDGVGELSMPYPALRVPMFTSI